MKTLTILLVALCTCLSCNRSPSPRKVVEAEVDRSCQPLIEEYKWNITNAMEAAKTSDPNLLVFRSSVIEYTCEGSGIATAVMRTEIKAIGDGKCFEYVMRHTVRIIRLDNGTLRVAPHEGGNLVMESLKKC